MICFFFISKELRKRIFKLKEREIETHQFLFFKYLNKLRLDLRLQDTTENEKNQ